MNAKPWLVASLIAISVSAGAEEQKSQAAADASAGQQQGEKPQKGAEAETVYLDDKGEPAGWIDAEGRFGVIVYASRTERRVEQIPGQVEVFTGADIAASGAEDLPRFLERAANLQLRTLNANPKQAQLGARGYGENSFDRIKIILDGADLNNVDMCAPDLTRIPLGNIERVEVIHGPSPVLHGDGAIAGVVNVETDTRDYAKVTRIAGKAGSQNTYGMNVATKGGVEKEGLFYQAAADYERSSGYRSRSAYENYSANAGVAKNFDNGSDAYLKANYSHGFFELPGSLTKRQWKHDAKDAFKRHDSSKTWNYGLSAGTKALLADGQWLYIDSSFDAQHREAQWGDYGYGNDYDLYSFRIKPRYFNENKIGGFRNEFTFGIDFGCDYYRVKDRSGYNNPSYDFYRLREGVYLQDEFFFSDRWSVRAGARLDNVNNEWRHYKGLQDDESNDWLQGYELALVYRPVDNMKAYVKGTRFFRSAFCDEMNYTKDGRFLDPETGWSADAGVEWNFLKNFSFAFNGYASWTKDEIFYNPYVHYYGYGMWGGYNENSDGDTRRLGFDTSFSWRKKGVAEAAVKYSFVDAQFTSGQYDGKDIPLVPRHRVRLDAGVWLCEGLEIKGGMTWTSKQHISGDFGNDHEELSSYPLFDAGAYYEPSWAKGWKLAFTINNIFDKEYCDFAGWSDYSGAYYYPGKGRSFLLTLSFEF